MYKQLQRVSRQPKKIPTRKILLKALGFQAVVLLIAAVVMTFFPERAASLVALIFIAFGVTCLLLNEVVDGRLGEPDVKADKQLR